MSEQLHIQSELARAPVPVLTRYAEGKLSSTEQAVVESFMEENPLYADALEGLQSLPTPATAEAAALDLRARTSRLLAKKRKPRINSFNFMQYATAAVAVLVVLFVASSAIYINFRIGQESPADTALADREDTSANDMIAKATPPADAEAPNNTLADSKISGDQAPIAEEPPVEQGTLDLEDEYETKELEMDGLADGLMAQTTQPTYSSSPGVPSQAGPQDNAAKPIVGETILADDFWQYAQFS